MNPQTSKNKIAASVRSWQFPFLLFLAAVCLASVAQAQIYVSGNSTSIRKYGLNSSLDNSFSLTMASGGFSYGMDLDGNTLYVANFGGYKVQTFNATTGALLGTALSTPSASPWDVAVHGNVMFTSYNGYNQFDWSTTSGANFAVLASTAFVPYQITLDSVGNAYVANFNGNTIVKYTIDYSGPTPVITNTNNSFISTGLNKPYGIAVDASGNIYVVNNGNGNISKYNSSGGVLSTTLVTGLNQAYGIGLDGLGSLYVADYGHNVIGKYSATSGGSYTGSGDSAFISAVGPIGLYVVTSSVPEPSALALLGIGAMGVLAWRRWRL